LVKRAIRIVIEQEQFDLRIGAIKTAHTDRELSEYLKRTHQIDITFQQIASFRSQLKIPKSGERQKINLFWQEEGGFSPWHELNIENIYQVPIHGGVYEVAYRDQSYKYPKRKSSTIYIGSSGNLRKRLKAHLSQNNHNDCLKESIKSRCVFRYIVFKRDWNI